MEGNMRLKVAPFRIYVDEVTALRRPQMSIRDAYGRLYDADLYYVYGYIVPGKGIRFRVLASASEKPFRLLSDQEIQRRYIERQVSYKESDGKTSRISMH